jgi:hypothetical protein
VRPSILDPYKQLIGEILEKHPLLRATRIHEMVAGRGYPGSAVQVRRYVATIRPRTKSEAFFGRPRTRAAGADRGSRPSHRGRHAVAGGPRPRPPRSRKAAPGRDRRPIRERNSWRTCRRRAPHKAQRGSERPAKAPALREAPTPPADSSAPPEVSPSKASRPDPPAPEPEFRSAGDESQPRSIAKLSSSPAPAATTMATCCAGNFSSTRGATFSRP